MSIIFLNLLFQQLNEKIRAHDSECITLVKSLGLVEDHSSMESTYTEQLLQRCAGNDLELDRLFIARYQEITSPEKTL
jgi:hypothetical protein